jgi:hypothetical protein
MDEEVERRIDSTLSFPVSTALMQCPGNMEIAAKEGSLPREAVEKIKNKELTL